MSGQSGKRDAMATTDKSPVTLRALLFAAVAQSNALESTVRSERRLEKSVHSLQASRDQISASQFAIYSSKRRLAKVAGVLVACFLLSLPAVVVFAPGDGNQAQAAAGTDDFRLVKGVVDGDTLVLETGEWVRLIGVDTPETKRPNTPVQYFGKEATGFVKRMVEQPRGISHCNYRVVTRSKILNASKREHSCICRTARS
jgi:Staphylococcal nuclease homologue